MKLLDPLYYTMYRFSLKTPLKDIGEHVGYMFVSLFLFTNIVVIAKNVGINILQHTPAKVASAIICGGMMILFYFLYISSKRYLELNVKYKEEKTKESSSRKVFVTIYIATTVMTLLFL